MVNKYVSTLAKDSNPLCQIIPFSATYALLLIVSRLFQNENVRLVVFVKPVFGYIFLFHKMRNDGLGIFPFTFKEDNFLFFVLSF